MFKDQRTMSEGESALHFLDVHIEKEVLGLYAGQVEMFEQKMNVLRRIVKEYDEKLCKGKE